MPDTHGGDYDVDQPDREEVSGFMDKLVENSLLAAEVGFDGLWVPERHMRTETYWPSPITYMATMAALTEDVTIGQYANVSTLYNPMQLAEELAVIDNLTEGRLVWTPVMGYHPGYWQHMGIQNGPETNLGRYIEGLEIVKEAWNSAKDDRFSYDGKYYQLDDVYQTPDPYQNPRPPIWTAGDSARAGRTADGIALVNFPHEEETLKEEIDTFKQSSREHGNDGRVILCRDAYVAETREEAEEVFGPIYREEMLYYFRHGILHHPDLQEESDFTVDNLSDHIVIGSPEDCVEQLAEYEEKFDVDYCVLRFRLAKGPSLDVEREAIQLFGDEVIPHFHDEDDGEWLLNP